MTFITIGRGCPPRILGGFQIVNGRAPDAARRIFLGVEEMRAWDGDRELSAAEIRELLERIQ